MKIKLTDYDGTNFLKDQKDVDAYIEAAFASGDPRLITRALGNVAKAKNLSKVSREAGLNRAGLFRSLSPDGDPKISTIIKVMDVLGQSLTCKPKKPAAGGNIALT